MWPHPKLPGAHFTQSALAHELGHVALPLCTDAQADEVGRKIVAEYHNTFDQQVFK
jgi:hypothetical protein